MRPESRGKSTSGQALAELAIVLPLFILLLLGLYDFACAIRANNAIANMSREGANLVSRPSTGMQNRRQQIMDALAATARPLDMRANGMMYITVVRGDTIQAQEGWLMSELHDAIASRVGTPSPSLPNPRVQGGLGLALAPNQTAYVVEVFYNYKSLFSSNALMLGEQLYSRSVF